MLPGRAAELGRLDELVTHLRAGDGRALALIGIDLLAHAEARGLVRIGGGRVAFVHRGGAGRPNLKGV